MSQAAALWPNSEGGRASLTLISAEVTTLFTSGKASGRDLFLPSDFFPSFYFSWWFVLLRENVGVPNCFGSCVDLGVL